MKGEGGQVRQREGGTRGERMLMRSCNRNGWCWWSLFRVVGGADTAEVQQCALIHGWT